jgi:hypothetical protein
MPIKEFPLKKKVGKKIFKVQNKIFFMNLMK